MAIALQAAEHNIRIVFDTSKLATDPFSYKVDGAEAREDFVIEVDSNVAVLRFYLETKTDDFDHQGTLATSPIQWLTPAGTAAAMPASFYFQRENDSKMTLIDLNSVAIPDRVAYNFEIAVVYQGRTYTSPDPTIVNVQPPPPDEVLSIDGKPVSAEGLLVS